MARFNLSTAGSDVTTNYEGGKAYKLSPEMNLYTQVCCTTLNNSFYKTASEQLKDIQALVAKVDPIFVAKLAIYARQKMNLRTIPLVLVVELAKIHNGDDLVSRMIQGVVCRADEITELLACYSALNGRTGTKKLNKLSRQVCKGLEKALTKFNEYSFGKYNRTSKEVTLKDVIMLVHPKPKTEEQASLYKKILDDKLETPYTWEVELSRAGQEKREKKVVWEELINSGKMGFMAQLRNVRNFLDEGVSKECIVKVGELLSNQEEVKKSKQFPYRFLSAYRAITQPKENGWVGRASQYKEIKDPKVAYLVDCLEKALKYSVDSLELFNATDSVLIAADVSGSMFDKVSAKSEISRYDIGILLSMILNYKCKFVTAGMFGDIFKTYNLPTSNIFKNIDEMYAREGEVGYGTHGYKVLEFAATSKEAYDKICIFTDEEMYGGDMNTPWKKIKQKNPHAKLYLFNLASYGKNTPIKVNEHDTYHISGWSSEIFSVLYNLEQGGKVLDEIRKISL